MRHLSTVSEVRLGGRRGGVALRDKFQRGTRQSEKAHGLEDKSEVTVVADGILEVHVPKKGGRRAKETGR